MKKQKKSIRKKGFYKRMIALSLILVTVVGCCSSCIYTIGTTTGEEYIVEDMEEIDVEEVLEE